MNTSADATSNLHLKMFAYAFLVTQLYGSQMIYSMTAFARLTSTYDLGTVIWEIRSVNHRYLEPSLKLPEPLRALEADLRDNIRKTLNRGKVECNLRIQTTPVNNVGSLQINQHLLEQLISVSEKIQKQLDQPAAINPVDILQWPGIVIDQQATQETDLSTECILTSFATVLAQLVDTRQREGATLQSHIEKKLDIIAEITAQVRQKLPAILQSQHAKLKERLKELKTELNPERLEQEMVILAQKADIDEELDRIDTHVKEVRRIFKKGGVCGRRLDFLMQELNREANTLSSKSIVTDTTSAAIELKVLIEQMREQIQNIE